MKEQYVGDVNDYRKYALLRALAQKGKGKGKVRIGVCWMLTPPDGRSDGSKRNYLEKPNKWRHYDPDLFDLLKSIVMDGDRKCLQRIEDSDIVPVAAYFNEILPDGKEERRAFFKAALNRFRKVDLVFFDPDNGIEVPSKPKGRKDSSKYLYYDEIATAYEAGLSILIYQHFPFEKREPYLQRRAKKLISLVSCERVWIYRTPHVAFFLLIHPRHANTLGRFARDAASRWDVKFLTGDLIKN